MLPSLRPAVRLIWFGCEPRGRVRHLVIGSGGTPACGREASDNMRYGYHEQRSSYEYDATVMTKPVCQGCKDALIDFGWHFDRFGLWGQR